SPFRDSLDPDQALAAEAAETPGMSRRRIVRFVFESCQTTKRSRPLHGDLARHAPEKTLLLHPSVEHALCAVVRRVHSGAAPAGGGAEGRGARGALCGLTAKRSPRSPVEKKVLPASRPPPRRSGSFVGRPTRPGETRRSRGGGRRTP